MDEPPAVQAPPARGPAIQGNAVITSDRRGLILSFNESAERMFGRSALHAVGQPLTILMPERFRDLHRAGIARFTTTGESRVMGRTVELAGLRADGTEFPIELSLASLSSGSDLVVTAVIRDITQRVELDEARQRLSNLQDLVIRVMGHDLKAPIAVVQNYLELALFSLAKMPEDPNREAVKRALGKAGEVAASMFVILGNARAISRLTMDEGAAPKREPVDAVKVVGQAVEGMRPLAEAKRQALEVSLPGELKMTLPPAFESVVWNLVSNAIKYTPAGGRISVRLTKGASSATLEVEDTGPGIPAEARQRIFRKFERLPRDESKGGHGLGLSIAASLVELGGGTLSVHDRADGKSGCLFRVEMPGRPEGAA